MAVVNEGDLKRLRDFIALKTGIYIDDSKLEKIYAKKIGEFLKQSRYAGDFNAFYSAMVFEKDSKTLQEFINFITVNETYFFRESYQFDTLVEHILPELDGLREPGESINILSAPCSSGEELYSIAIYIMEKSSLIKKRDFSLVGIDIDSSMIEKAKRGVYRHRSVAKIPQDILNRYFKKVSNDSYEIEKNLRESLSFEILNVLDIYSLRRLGSFDVVFSRNMLIYFDDKKRREVISSFYSILKPNGYLLLGHAEKVPDDMSLFERIKLGESIVYRKR